MSLRLCDGKEGIELADWTPAADAYAHEEPLLRLTVCNLVGGGLSKTEWAQYAAGIPYRQSCS